MKWKRRLGLVCATHVLVALLSISTAASERLAYWDFEQVQDRSLRERAGWVADTIHGHWKQVMGAQGRGLWFDGFTTCVQRQAGQAPALGDTWAITAWIAPHAYPWGWCPIVSQHQNRQRGYFFGLDAEGHIGLHLFVNGKWRSFVTGDKVPYRQWSFVAGVYDGQQGVRGTYQWPSSRHVVLDGHPCVRS